MSNNRLFLVLGLAAGGWLLYQLGPILTPFVVAALLAYICDPLVDRLESLRVPRTLGVLIVFILLFSAIGAVVVLVIPVVQAQVAHLVEKIPGYVQWIEERILPRLMERLEVAGDGEPMGLSAFLTQYGDHAASWGTRILASITSSGSALLTAVVSLFLIPILTFYMLRDWDRIIDRVGKLVPMRYREVAFQLAGETDTMLGAFFRGQLLVMLALAIMYTTGLMIVGLPHALAIGVVSGLVSFIPYLGLVVGILLAGLTALVETGSPLTLAGSDSHFYRVGGHQPIRANVRVITATHQDLEKRVKEGLFREDLFHRLNVIRLRLPPLRERREDIPLLARHFAQASARELGVEPKRLTDDAIKYLASRDWPGNVRQLENVCHWINVMAPGVTVGVKGLPPELRGEANESADDDWISALEREIELRLKRGESSILDELNRQFERTLIMRALSHTGGRRIEASHLLGMGRNTLTRKIQELRLDEVAKDK